MQGYRQRRAYIATQGPLSGTVVDMWRMIWENNCSCVVMLCQTMEMGQVLFYLKRFSFSSLAVSLLFLFIIPKFIYISIVLFLLPLIKGKQLLFLASECGGKEYLWEH